MISGERYIVFGPVESTFPYNPYTRVRGYIHHIILHGKDVLHRLYPYLSVTYYMLSCITTINIMVIHYRKYYPVIK
jgi:hypothetical protein